MSRDLAEPLVGADEMVDGGDLMELKGDAELKGIESANLSLKAVVRDEFPGTDVVDVEQTEDLIPAASDVSREESTEPGEFESDGLVIDQVLHGERSLVGRRPHPGRCPDLEYECARGGSGGRSWRDRGRSAGLVREGRVLPRALIRC